jgi:hypothetical protein
VTTPVSGVLIAVDDLSPISKPAKAKTLELASLAAVDLSDDPSSRARAKLRDLKSPASGSSVR